MSTPRYRSNISQLLSNGEYFITDGGIETTLIFHHGLDLPHFAAYDLLKNSTTTETLTDCYRAYGKLAQKHNLNLILESATWRGSSDWGDKLGYSKAELKQANVESIQLLENLRQEFNESNKILISACVGPRGDGYVTGESLMTAQEAEEYHSQQIEILSQTNADLLTAMTLNYANEAIGIVQAAKQYKMPVVISFTVETNGHLPTGQSLQSAIQEVDAATDHYALYFMINCAHPTHFAHIFDTGTWVRRIQGIRANASCKSHAELEESTSLDEGNPKEFGRQCSDLRAMLPELKVIGGCCGTDERHIEAIAKELVVAKAG